MQPCPRYLPLTLGNSTLVSLLTKIKKQSREDRIYFISHFQISVHHSKNITAANAYRSWSHRAQNDAFSVLSWLCTLFQSRAQQQEMVPPTFTLSLSPSMKAIKTIPHRCAYRSTWPRQSLAEILFPGILGCTRLAKLTMTCSLPHHQHLHQSGPFIIVDKPDNLTIRWIP